MKRVIAFSILFFLFIGFAAAQGKPRSTVRIRLNDDYPLTVNINDRDYKKIGQTITIGDLPKKRHDIRVYRIRTYSDGSGAKADLVYSGRIKLEPGSTYDCIVDVKSRKFRMKKVKELPVLNVNQNGIQSVPENNIQEPVHNEIEMPTVKKEYPKLKSLQTQLEKANTETERLQLAKKFVSNNTITTEEAAYISSFLLFDDNKVAFFKHAKPQLSDPQNFIDLAAELTMEDAKMEFKKL